MLYCVVMGSYKKRDGHKWSIPKLLRVAGAAAILSSALAAPVMAGPEQSIYFLTGEKVMNTYTDSTSSDAGITDIIKFKRNEFALGVMDEGLEEGGIRTGIYADYLFRYKIADNINGFLGIGPYVTWKVPVGEENTGVNTALNTDITLGFTTRINHDLSLIFQWVQVKTGLIVIQDSRNTDADNFMVGAGYRFGNGDNTRYKNSSFEVFFGRSDASMGSATDWGALDDIHKNGYSIKVGYLNEGHLYTNEGGETKRDGIFVQLSTDLYSNNFLKVFASAGPYISSTTRVNRDMNACREVAGTQVCQETAKDAYNINLYASSGVKLLLPDRWEITGSANYIYTGRFFDHNNTNSVFWGVGVGYRF